MKFITDARFAIIISLLTVLSVVAAPAVPSFLKGRFASTLLPREQDGHADTLGGASLGVSRHAKHPREAIALVDPRVLNANPLFAQLKHVLLKGFVARPSTVTGKEYPRVSEAYFQAVHSVLTGTKSAEQAAANP